MAAALRRLQPSKTIALIEMDGGIASPEAEQEVVIGRQFGLPITRYYGLGGTSSLWGGACVLPNAQDFRSNAWPIDLTELLPFYDIALQSLGLLSKSDLDAANERVDVKNDIAALFVNGVAAEFQFELIQQLLPAPNLFHKYDIISLGVNVIRNAYCTKLNFLSPRRVESITVEIDGEKIAIKAKKFILCCGALSTPYLLHRSGSIDKSLLCNKNIGCYLSDHPMGFIGQVRFKRKVAAPYFHRVKGSNDIRYKLGINHSRYGFNHKYYLIPSFKVGSSTVTEDVKRALLTVRERSLSFSEIMTLVRNPSVVLQILSYLFANNPKVSLYDIWMIGDQRADCGSLVKRDLGLDGVEKKIINWELSKENIDEMYEAKEEFINLLRYAGFSVTAHIDRSHFKEYLTSAAHHSGTCRMGLTSQDGVVDKNLQVFDIDNLYISDASVIPTGGNANPSLTIIALNYRLAEFLAANE